MGIDPEVLLFLSRAEPGIINAKRISEIIRELLRADVSDDTNLVVPVSLHRPVYRTASEHRDHNNLDGTAGLAKHN